MLAPHTVTNAVSQPQGIDSISALGSVFGPVWPLLQAVAKVWMGGAAQ